MPFARVEDVLMLSPSLVTAANCTFLAGVEDELDYHQPWSLQQAAHLFTGVEDESDATTIPGYRFKLYLSLGLKMY